MKKGAAIYAPSGLAGEVVEVYDPGYGLFRATTGAVFTVREGELESPDWAPDALDKMFQEAQNVSYQVKDTPFRRGK